jgi:hypothetical protein
MKFFRQAFMAGQMWQGQSLAPLPFVKLLRSKIKNGMG